MRRHEQFPMPFFRIAVRTVECKIAAILMIMSGSASALPAQGLNTSEQGSGIAAQDSNPNEPQASSENDAGLRLIRESIYILRHQTLNREEEWTTAIRTLVRIGSPAVPELIQELDRPNRGATLRSLGFTLRAIGDPRAVPALIRAIPETLRPSESDCGIHVFDEKLMQFMKEHDRRPRDNEVSFSFGRPVNEIFDAIEKMTGHRIADGVERDDLRSISLEGDETLDARSRELFARRQAAWEQWWSEHRTEFLTDDELASLEPIDVHDDPVERAGIAKFGRPFPTGPSVKLGPVRDVILRNDSVMDGARCLDFDRQQVLPVRKGIKTFPYPDDSWMTSWWSKQHGIDCFSYGWRLSSGDLRIWQIDNARWATIDEEVTLDQPLELGPERPYIQPMPLEGSYYDIDLTITTTFLLTTREGASVILQVFPHSEGEPTKIRYRLWNDQISSAAEITVAEPAASEEWTEEMTVTLNPPGPNLRFVAHLPTASALAVPIDVLREGPMSQAAVQWYINHGCDLRADVINVHDLAAANPDDPDAEAPVFQVLGVYGRQMCAVPISGDGYASLSASDIRDLMSRWPRRMQWAYLDGDRGSQPGFLSSKPFFHAFLTESGRVGVLTYSTQRGVTNKVTVKYRLSKAK